MPDQKLPWFKFSPDRWQSDEALGMCGAVARAVWIECICIMHKATPYGHLVVNGLVPTVEQLARICRLPASDIAAGLLELEANRVFSRNKAGVIYSRCMTRAEKKARIARENGKMAGAASRCSETPISPSGTDTPPDKSLRDSEEKKDSGLRPAAEAARAPDPVPIPVPPKQQLFSKPLIARMAEKTGKTPDAVRTLFAMAERDIGAGQALEIAVEAISATVPLEYFMGAYRKRRGTRNAPDRPRTANDAAASDLLNAFHNPDFEYSVGVPSHG